MNLLAHAYLSFENEEILTGNMMADFTRGKPTPSLPEKIKNGILLHREIDDFTDHHPINIATYALFRESAGRFAPVFLDIAYDYFLANSSQYFPTQEKREAFAQNTYQAIEKHIEHTGERFQELFFRMKAQNWLARYNQKESIARSFHSVTYRTKHITNTDTIFEAFEKQENQLQQAFDSFFPELETHVKKMLFRLA